MEKIRQLLVRREQELSLALGDSRVEMQIEQVSDTFDAIQQATQRDLGVIHNQREFDERAQVRLAIARIDSGEYGVCMHCEKPIPPRRLEVVPWANYCVRCQERHQTEDSKPVFTVTKDSGAQNSTEQKKDRRSTSESVWDKITQPSRYVGGSYPSQVYKSKVNEK